MKISVTQNQTGEIINMCECVCATGRITNGYEWLCATFSYMVSRPAVAPTLRYLPLYDLSNCPYVTIAALTSLSSGSSDGALHDEIWPYTSIEWVVCPPTRRDLPFHDPSKWVPRFTYRSTGAAAPTFRDRTLHDIFDINKYRWVVCPNPIHR
jgi:hypothetical protein